MADNKIMLLDGHSLLNRAFYGLPALTNAEGKHTNAVLGFLNIMLRYMEEEKPTHLLAAFDRKEPTFRHLKYKEYKDNYEYMYELSAYLLSFSDTVQYLYNESSREEATR